MRWVPHGPSSFHWARKNALTTAGIRKRCSAGSPPTCRIDGPPTHPHSTPSTISVPCVYSNIQKRESVCSCVGGSKPPPLCSSGSGVCTRIDISTYTHRQAGAKKRAQRRREGKEAGQGMTGGTDRLLHPSLVHVISGTVSGVLSAAVVHPIDLIKTRLQGVVAVLVLSFLLCSTHTHSLCVCMFLCVCVCVCSCVCVCVCVCVCAARCLAHACSLVVSMWLCMSMSLCARVCECHVHALLWVFTADGLLWEFCVFAMHTLQGLLTPVRARTCVSAHVCICVCLYDVYVCWHTYSNVRLSACVYVHMTACMCVNMKKYLHTCVCVYILCVCAFTSLLHVRECDPHPLFFRGDPSDLPATAAQERWSGSSVGRPQYHGTMHAVRSIMQQEGWQGLYKGISPALLGSGSSWGLYFLA